MIMPWLKVSTVCTGHGAGCVTPFHDDTVIGEHIDVGITLTDAVNFHVERYELIRTDRKGVTWQEPTPFLTATHILRAKRTSAMMNT